MIPKIIHYVWVGGNPKPDMMLDCIASWKKYLPDYEIMEWGDDALEKIDNRYAKEAAENKKWAFVSDYIRLYALYNYGGFYFDTDLELTASIDKFRDKNFITGYEKHNNAIFPLTALMGAEKHSPITKGLLADYDNLPFVTKNGFDQTTNVIRVSKYLCRTFGFKEPYDGLKEATFDDNCIIYPYFYFCTPEEGKPNYSIHHFSGSWLDDYSRKLKFKIGSWKLVRFKKRPKIVEGKLPITDKEQKIFEFGLSKKKRFVLLRDKK